MRARLEIIGVVALLLIAGFAAVSQYRKSIEVAGVQGEARAMAKLQSEFDARLKSLEVADRERQKEYERKTEALEKLTAQQIVVKVPEYVPQASKPIVIVGPETSKTELKPGDAIVPQEDIKPIAHALLDRDKCKGDLVSCSAKNVEWQKKYELKADESQKWERVARGGSAFGRAVKCIAVRGGVAGSTGAAVGKDRVQGLEVGAAIGAASCLLWR